MKTKLLFVLACLPHGVCWWRIKRAMVLATRSLALIGACLLQAWATSHAATIYDTFGPEPYTPGQHAYQIEWTFFTTTGSGRNMANTFMVTGTPYELDSITLDIGFSYGEAAPNLRIGIHGNEAGHPAAAPLTVVEPDPTYTTAQRQAISYSFPNKIILLPNVPYWLVLGPKTLAVGTQVFNAEYLVSTSTYRPTNGASLRTIYLPGGSWTDWTFYPETPAMVFRLEGSSVLFLDHITRTNDQTILHWQGGSGLYQLQSRTNLTTDTWQNLGPATTNTAATNLTSSTLFFRVQSLPNP